MHFPDLCCFSFTTCRKQLVLYVFLLFTNIARTQIINDYPQNPNLHSPEVIRRLPGGPIKLKCSMNACPANVEFKWGFQPCSTELHKPNCHIENAEWKRLTKNVKTKFCSSSFTIKNFTKNHVGLYRCTTLDPHSNYVMAAKCYELRMEESFNYKDGPKAKVIEIEPTNITVMNNEKIVIKCKVHSTTGPKICWLKRLDSFAPNLINNNNSVILYKNESYLSINANQGSMLNDIYVSKLIIDKSTEFDSGIYVCIAINMFGVNDVGKTAYVNVIVSNNNTTSFSLLFLIPFAFALVPITGWLCLYFCKNRKFCERNFEKQYQPVCRNNATTRSNNTNHGFV